MNTTRNRPATIKRIVNALADTLAKQGLEGVSVSLIAEKAGVSKILVYRYFGGLDGLFEYYLKTGYLLPAYTDTSLDQIRPAQKEDLAQTWSAQTKQLFRRFRSCRAARELLKATVKEKNDLAETISQAYDTELTRLVDQLAFIEGADHKAISAIILSGLAHLTIQAQLDRPILGFDLRSEANWERIENALQVIFKALNRSVIDSPTTWFIGKEVSIPADSW